MAMLHEVNWRKSTYSGHADNNCVELTTAEGKVLVRESEDPGAVVTTTRASLGTFIRTAKRGGLDDLAPSR
ncbi:DUF397 domain-containing protein [Streptomyces sp. NPDC059850]|uniref:DUF397 domain-containing protein n=1 Tax=Streptomyces sp. NPDC059850 TaxID=3346970 RepID=UPI00365C17B9